MLPQGYAVNQSNRDEESLSNVNPQDLVDVLHQTAATTERLIQENAELRGWVRQRTREAGVVECAAISGKENEVSKYQDYYRFSQRFHEIPSHRMLAMRRGPCGQGRRG